MPQYGVKRRKPVQAPVFVPVARDGTPFHPGLRRASGFTFGEKGAERQVGEFDEALGSGGRASMQAISRSSPRTRPTGCPGSIAPDGSTNSEIAPYAIVTNPITE